jgi:hypothetical protein
MAVGCVIRARAMVIAGCVLKAVGAGQVSCAAEELTVLQRTSLLAVGVLGSTCSIM